MTYKVVYDQKTHTNHIEFDESIVTPVPLADWDSVFSVLEDHDTPTILDQAKHALSMLASDLALVLSLGMVIALGVAITKLFI